MSRTAIGYGRKSCGNDNRRTSSVGDQRVAAEAYAASRGFDLIAFHGDHGITGAKMERPGLQRVLAATAEGSVNVLIIEDVDRLRRDHEDLRLVYRILRGHGVTLHTVAAGPTDDPVSSSTSVHFGRSSTDASEPTGANQDAAAGNEA